MCYGNNDYIICGQLLSKSLTSEMEIADLFHMLLNAVHVLNSLWYNDIEYRV